MFSRHRDGLGKALHRVKQLRYQSSAPYLSREGGWSHPPTTATISDREIARLASSPRRPVTLADLLKHGKPPLSEETLLASANYALSMVPSRLAHRVQSLRNLPFIVVANPNISKIYDNYLNTLSTLEPYYQRKITTLQDEEKFTNVLAELVQTHANTIPVLAQGFLECRKYISPQDVTRFLDRHLRARIGTRLICEQHIALHFGSTPEARKQKLNPNVIGVIDTELRPADIILSCADFVGEICELKYGIRPSVVLKGEVDVQFAHVPMHLEYIITELLKNSFRATIEAGNESKPVEITIAAAPDVPHTKLDSLKQLTFADDNTHDFSQDGLDEYCADSATMQGPLHNASHSITIRIRDTGGGIPPEVLPSIWTYSFTTFNEDDASPGGSIDGLNAIANGGNTSSIAGLGYGLPLGRAYAEYFGGSISIQSMYRWGTDVYLSLQGIGMQGIERIVQDSN